MRCPSSEIAIGPFTRGGLKTPADRAVATRIVDGPIWNKPMLTGILGPEVDAGYLSRSLHHESQISELTEFWSLPCQAFLPEISDARRL
jgi:hypothetical protein